MDRLIGTGVALVTPFDEQQRIDRESLYRLVNYVIDGGVDFLVALGTTAETATLSADERAVVVLKGGFTNILKRLPLLRRCLCVYTMFRGGVG